MQARATATRPMQTSHLWTERPSKQAPREGGYLLSLETHLFCNKGQHYIEGRCFSFRISQEAQTFY